jgi:hypothetical protein
MFSLLWWSLSSNWTCYAWCFSWHFSRANEPTLVSFIVYWPQCCTICSPHVFLLMQIRGLENMWLVSRSYGQNFIMFGHCLIVFFIFLPRSLYAKISNASSSNTRRVRYSWPWNFALKLCGDIPLGVWLKFHNFWIPFGRVFYFSLKIALCWFSPFLVSSFAMSFYCSKELM